MTMCNRKKVAVYSEYFTRTSVPDDLVSPRREVFEAFIEGHPQWPGKHWLPTTVKEKYIAFD
jgi:hypothetical protein